MSSFNSLNKILRADMKSVGQLAGRASFRLLGAVVMSILLVLSSTWPIDWLKFLGILLLSLVTGLMLRAHLEYNQHQADERRNKERLIWATSLLAVAGVQAAMLSINAAEIETVGFLLVAPLAAQAMLVSALLKPSTGIVSLTMTVLLLGIPGVIPFELLVAGWMSGSVAAHIVNPMKRRSDLFRAMTILTAAQVVIAISISTIQSYSFLHGLEVMVWSIVAALIATSIFWLGVAILEKAFGITSDWTLLELCGPDQPLLRELNLRAPGTYAHSVRVGNLAEEAASAVGANPLECRTISLYHDVGKIVRPNYFIENQVGENVHDDLTPSLSAQVVAEHVKDGLELAEKYKLPQNIRNAIAQHHGTSLITYFYHRALEQGDASEETYRYPGPKPQTKEIAILHLADTVEAASRCFKKGDNIPRIIEGLIEKSRADGQLDESDLTLRDLGLIANSFVRNIQAMQHQRILYPGQEGSDVASSHSSSSTAKTHPH